MGTNTREPHFGYNHFRLRIEQLEQELAEARAAVAEAVAAEREACCAALCSYCAGEEDGYNPMPELQPTLYNGPKVWIHKPVQGKGKFAVGCKAAAIRARGEGRKEENERTS